MPEKGVEMPDTQGAKIVVLYQHPDDPAAFDTRYFDGHVPLVMQLPGLRRLEVHRGLGKDAPYYLLVEMAFDSLADLRTCMRSEMMGLVVEDANEFAAGLFTVLVVETAVARDTTAGGA
jgi:uncharacterized protein (TIGR02118 family)